MNTTISIRFHQQGLSLIELMIAMLIGTLIVFAVGSIAISNQNTFRSNQAIADVQDAARTAFELMARDIRQAGDDGCGNLRIAKYGNTEDANKQWWIGSPSNTGWPGALSITPSNTANPVAPGHTLTLLGAGSEMRSIESSTANSITVFPGDAPFTKNDFIVACDWEHPGQVVQVASVDGNTINLADNALSPVLPANATVSNYKAVQWFVRAGTGTNPSVLRRTEYTGAGSTTNDILPGVNKIAVTARVEGQADFQTYGSISENDRSKIDALQIVYTLESLENNTATAAQNNKARIERTYTIVVPLNNRTKKTFTANAAGN